MTEQAVVQAKRGGSPPLFGLKGSLVQVTSRQAQARV